jgi:hypothetical protein
MLFISVCRREYSSDRHASLDSYALSIATNRSTAYGMLMAILSLKPHTTLPPHSHKIYVALVAAIHLSTQGFGTRFIRAKFAY